MGVLGLAMPMPCLVNDTGTIGWVAKQAHAFYHTVLALASSAGNSTPKIIEGTRTPASTFLKTKGHASFLVLLSQNSS